MSLLSVVKSLVWCLICRYAETKGAWRRDGDWGGARTSEPLPS